MNGTRGNDSENDAPSALEAYARCLLKNGSVVAASIGLAAASYAVYSFYLLIIPALFISALLVVPGLVLFGLGVYTPLFAIIGWRGLNRGNIRDIKACHLGMWLLMAISTALAAFVGLLAGYSSGSSEGLHKAVFYYHEDSNLASQMNMAQRHLGCCGVVSVNDWNMNEYFSCDEENPHHSKCNVPASCCVKQDNEIPYGCGRNLLNDSLYDPISLDKIVYSKGCLHVMDRNFYSCFLYIQILTLILLACQLSILRSARLIELFQRRRNQENQPRHL